MNENKETACGWVNDFDPIAYFNVNYRKENQKVEIFGIKINMTLQEWLKSDAYQIFRKMDIKPFEWVWHSEIKNKEDLNYKWILTKGYLKSCDNTKAYINWWNSLTDKERDSIKSIPNFDGNKFFKITGIKV